VTIEKNVNFFNGGVFFLLTCPLMGDPVFSRYDPDSLYYSRYDPDYFSKRVENL